MIYLMRCYWTTWSIVAKWMIWVTLIFEFWAQHWWNIFKPNSTWVGITKPILSFPLFSRFVNNFKKLVIMFISDRCHHSSATVTPVKYEIDSKNLRGIFGKWKINLTEKFTNRALVTSTPGPLCPAAYVNDIIHYFLLVIQFVAPFISMLQYYNNSKALLLQKLHPYVIKSDWEHRIMKCQIV